jgi:hypothetical protein
MELALFNDCPIPDVECVAICRRNAEDGTSFIVSKYLQLGTCYLHGYQSICQYTKETENPDESSLANQVDPINIIFMTSMR